MEKRNFHVMRLFFIKSVEVQVDIILHGLQARYKMKTEWIRICGKKHLLHNSFKLWFCVRIMISCSSVGDALGHCSLH